MSFRGRRIVLCEASQAARLGFGSLIAATLLAACGGDLGECDMPAAQELVYSESGLVATKGQALTHDTCGNGVFCHSSAARGDQRYGAPGGMNFDMLPEPEGLSEMLEYADDAWDVVEAGEMPPRGVGATVLGTGGWSISVVGEAEAPKLPSLLTNQGKAIFRNWLACGAPTVSDTELPEWARPPMDPFDGGTTPAWSDIYEIILEPKCALAGCHKPGSVSGGLVMPDLCGTYDALMGSGACGQRYVTPGDADGSFLMDKLEASPPRCGGAMPPTGRLAENLRNAVRDWIDAGAQAEGCP